MIQIAIEIQAKETYCYQCEYLKEYQFTDDYCELFESYLGQGKTGPVRCKDCLNAEINDLM